MSLNERDYMRRDQRAGNFGGFGAGGFGGLPNGGFGAGAILRALALNALRNFRWTWTRRLVAITTGAFFVQTLVSLIGGADVENWLLANLALSWNGIAGGAVWTLLTHAFLHAGFWHLLFNMLALWFIGSRVEQTDGWRTLFGVYFGGILAGATAWLALAAQAPADLGSRFGFFAAQHLCIGASAGVYAALTFVFIKNLKQHFQFIVLVFPVKLRADIALALLGGFALLGLFAAEIPATTGAWRAYWRGDDTAHSAHIGGMLWALALSASAWWRLKHPRRPRQKVSPFKQTVDLENTIPFRREQRAGESEQWSVVNEDEDAGGNGVKSIADVAGVAGVESIENTAGTNSAGTNTAGTALPQISDALRAEVNRILDKINAIGIGSISPSERATLERAAAAFARSAS